MPFVGQFSYKRLTLDQAADIQSEAEDLLSGADCRLNEGHTQHIWSRAAHRR